MDALTTETEKEKKTSRVRSFKISRETIEPKEGDEKSSTTALKIDRILANPGDTIRWEIDAGHTVSIWFPDAGVFVTPVLAVMHEGSVEATIRDDVLEGESGVIVREYAIFDHTDREFVTCESHPKIEIPKAGE